MLSSTWPILSISFRFIRWDKITEWAKCCTSVLLQDSNGCFSRWSIYAACQIHTLIKYEASYQHAILRYFIFLFRLLMAKSGKNLTVRRWHHLLMPESKGKQPWLLISRTLVWWMRTSAAAPYSSTLMVLMQEIRNHFLWVQTSVPGLGDPELPLVKKITMMSRQPWPMVTLLPMELTVQAPARMLSNWAAACWIANQNGPEL